ncbi:MAG: hypothetical protein FWE96_03300, partial [Coriobacteriia bacterium]|nr:hypothetical protein [Coriobacteriia bacterium]
GQIGTLTPSPLFQPRPPVPTPSLCSSPVGSEPRKTVKFFIDWQQFAAKSLFVSEKALRREYSALRGIDLGE